MVSRQLFKSRKFIVLFSMMVNILLILIGSLWFDNNYIHLELSSLLILSLLLGPYSILGFTIVEVLYGILFLDMSGVSVILLSSLSLFVLGVLPWKLWYVINAKDRFEIPNMNSFYSLTKLIIIVFIMILQTYLSANQIFYNTVELNLEIYYIIFILGLVLLLVGMGFFGKFKIPVYKPKQVKRLMPDKLYVLAFIVSILLSIVTLNNQNYGCIVLILILSAIFLIKPVDERILKIDNTQRLSIFYKVFISIFIILIIIPTILLISLTLSGFYGHGIASEFLNYLVILAGFFLAILIPLVIYMLFLSRHVIRPINQLSEYLSEDIKDGDDLKNLVNNLDSISVNNEIKSLSESLLNMEKEYVDYSTNLLDVTKEKERYETELKLAHEIQSSMIPTDFDIFDEEDVNLWGFMKAAHDVGGDFYDYFKIDDDNIGFVIGDVSGKGVSTALIMVKVMTLIRDYATYYSDVSDVFYEVNNELCKDYLGDAVISCWLGKFNTKTKDLAYVNAGHSQPFIKHDGGSFEFLNDDSGLCLAIREDKYYNKYVMHILPDDTFFLYTDGVTDAINTRNEPYGEENLQKTLNQNKDKELNRIIESVEKDISEFCNGRELSDDTTMFIVELI